MKKWWIVIAAFLCAFLVFIGFAPTIISSDWGNAYLITRINKRISGEASFEKLDISWFGPQKVDSFKLNNKSGEVIFSVKEIVSDSSLLALAIKRVGKSEIDTPYLYLSKNEASSTKKNGKKSKSRKRGSSYKKYPTFTGELTLIDGEMILDSPKVSAVHLSDLQVSYKPKEDIFHVSGKTRQGAVEGNLLASGNLSKKLHVLAKINNFPVSLLDQIRDQSFYTTAIGTTLDCTIETRKENGHYTLSAELSSLNLSGKISGTTRDGSLTIDPGAQLTYTLTPATFYTMLGPQQRKYWSLASKSELAISIKEGQFPIDRKIDEISDIQLNAEVSMDRAEVIHKDAGPYSLNNFKAQVLTKDDLEFFGSTHLIGKEGSKLAFSGKMNDDKDFSYALNAVGLPYALIELFFEEANIMHAAFGEMISLNIAGSYIKGKSANHIEVDSPKTKFEGDIEGATLSELSFSIVGEQQLEGDWREVFGPKVELALAGRAAVEERSLALSTLTGKLSNPYFDVDIRGRVGERGKPFSYDQLRLSANGTLLALPYQETLGDTTLKKGNFVIDLDGSKNRAVATGKLLVATENIDSQASEIKIEMKEFIYNEKLDWQNANLTFNANLQHFPAAIIDPLLPEGIDLLFITGPIVNAEAKGSYTPRASDHLAQIDLKASSNSFKTQFSIAVDGTLTINQPEPAFIHWEVTPERYAQIMKKVAPEKSTELTLSKTASVDFRLTELKCPSVIPDKLSSFLCQTGIEGDLTITPMVFMNRDEILTIKGIKGVVKGENFSKKINVDLKGDLFAPNIPTHEASTFSFVGDILNLWTHEGKLDHDSLTVAAEANLELIPITQITGIVPMSDESRKISRALLGELLNARVSGEVHEMSGPVTIDIKSSNFKALLPLQLTRDTIFLRDYVDAEITLTDQLSQDLLVDIFPLVKGASSDHPLKLFIDPEGFSVDINPYILKGINIQKAIIDIGNIQILNGPHIQALMDFLKATEFSKDKWMPAWFTPIFISMKEGTLSYKRFDILLAERVHIALWGRTDLVKDKIKMTLGIAPATLMQRFNVVGISNENLFQVKMRGKISDVDLDWSSAYTRVGLLVARLTGGHLGYLVGGVIEQIVGLFGDEKSPPPTTIPFPWESKYPSVPGEVIPQEANPKSLKKKAMKKAREFLAP